MSYPSSLESVSQAQRFTIALIAWSNTMVEVHLLSIIMYPESYQNILVCVVLSFAPNGFCSALPMYAGPSE